MPDILDYVAWRGDVPFSAAPFNEIDALILCQVSYLDLSGIVPEGFRRPVLFSDAARAFENSSDFERRADTGALINKRTARLFIEAGRERRFGGMKVCGCQSKSDSEKEEQFSAVTFLTGKKEAFAAYRGTDDTIVGWKEDFNLAVMDTVPAQADALEYLRRAMKSLRAAFRAGGHSKGGNLAVYACAMADESLKRRVKEIYNLDGPGFPDEKINSRPFKSIEGKIKSLYPQLSIVGMLFSRAGAFSVVESERSGLMQHDPFSWRLGAKEFVRRDGFDSASVVFHDTFNDWIKSVGEDDRAAFVETLFSVIEATDARTNSELEANWLKNSARVIKAMAKIEPEAREQVARTVQTLFKAARLNAPKLLK